MPVSLHAILWIVYSSFLFIFTFQSTIWVVLKYRLWKMDVFSNFYSIYYSYFYSFL
jgi:hypothetical protein